jgi:hypothetical protein
VPPQAKLTLLAGHLQALAVKLSRLPDYRSPPTHRNNIQEDSFNDLPKAPQSRMDRVVLSGEGGLDDRQKSKLRKPFWYPKCYSLSYDTLRRTVCSNPGMPGRLILVFDI